MLSPDRFERFAGAHEALSYDTRVSSPFAVTRQTDVLMRGYFAGLFADTKPMAQYLQEFTLPFIYEAQYALPTVEFLSRELGTNDYERIKKYIGETVAPSALQEAILTLDFTASIFSFMPELYRADDIVPTGFSRKGMLKPPATTDEFVGRLSELGEIITYLKAGEIVWNTWLLKDRSILRTRAFFEVGARMPLLAQTKGRAEVVHETSQRLLDSLDFSIDL
ncbi:MAG TPA: hypothetical protein VJC10_00785 [Patescibacteria group bacterium]|nr:hypothetical protein [Patescibacteria group bacterium]